MIASAPVRNAPADAARRASPRRSAPESSPTTPPVDGGGVERPSKTRRKAASHDLQALGETLATWDDARLAVLPLPGTLLDAIALARRITAHGARKRQMQLIGKLMRTVADVDPIRAAVDAAARGRTEDAARFHLAERWRTALVDDDDDEAATRFAAAHPGVDLQRLRALVRQARKDAALPPEERHGKAWRDLFRFVRDAARPNDAAADEDRDG
jgi:ribosome-associated protein